MSAQTVHAFTTVGDPREIPAETSLIPYWETVEVEPGDSIARGCEPFLAKVTSVTPPNCWNLVAAVNGLKSFTILPGQRLLLPSSANTEAEVAARLAAYAAKAEVDAKDNAELQALADNPLGMASEIRRVLVGFDQIAKKLAVLEAETLDAAQTEEMVTKVLSLVDVVDKTALTASVEQALTAARAQGDLTAFQVSDIITAQLALAGLSETTQMRAIINAQTIRLDTLEATQQAQAATLTAHSTALEEQDGRIASTEARLESQATVLKEQGIAVEDLKDTDTGLATSLGTLATRVETLEQGGSFVSVPVVVAVLVSLLTLVGAGIFTRRQRNVVKEVTLAVKDHHDRLEVVEKSMTSGASRPEIPLSLETDLAKLTPGLTHEVDIKLGDEVFVVSFKPALSTKNGEPMVLVKGVADQTQPMHISKARSILTKAGYKRRFTTLRPVVPVAARLAA